MVKTAGKRWDAQVVDYGDFLYWATLNWLKIMRRQFKWMTKTKPPQAPTVEFFIRFLPQFQECWTKAEIGEREREDRRKPRPKILPPRELIDAQARKTQARKLHVPTPMVGGDWEKDFEATQGKGPNHGNY
jgi:hypothetical protein